MWYHKDLYDEHNNSLDRFIEKFNESSIYKNLIAVRNPLENQRHDGVIIDLDTKTMIAFDWSKSQKALFIEDKWKYKNYTLIASKYNILSTDLYITTDINENHILTVWRQDIDINRKKYFIDFGQGGEIVRPVFEVDNYEIFQINDITKFKIYIKQCLKKSLEVKSNENK